MEAGSSAEFFGRSRSLTKSFKSACVNSWGIPPNLPGASNSSSMSLVSSVGTKSLSLSKISRALNTVTGSSLEWGMGCKADGRFRYFMEDLVFEVSPETLTLQMQQSQNDFSSLSIPQGPQKWNDFSLFSINSGWTHMMHILYEGPMDHNVFLLLYFDWMENAESAGEMVLTISVTANEWTQVVAKDDAHHSNSFR